MNFQRFYHIVRASRFVSAAFWQQRRNEPLVNSDKNNERKVDDFVEHDLQK